MNILENAIKLENLVNEICRVKKLDIKELIEREDPEFSLVWRQAQTIFFN